MTEEEIASLFERVARDLDFPGIEALVSGAERSGRRRRHRHRALLGTGSVLAAGAIVVAGTTGVAARLTRALGPAQGPASPAGAVSPARAVSPTSTPASISTSPSSAPARTVSASPTPTRRATATASHGRAMTATQIIDDLRAMLPATSTISDIRDTSAKIWHTESPGVEFNYSDGHGKADVQFGIYGPGFLQQNAQDCSVPTTNGSPRPPGAPPVSCTSKTLPDGSLLLDVVTATDYWSFYEYQIDVVRPDGVTISLAVGDGTLDSGQRDSSGIVTPVVTRAVPPGSFAEWNAVAESPIWHL